MTQQVWALIHVGEDSRGQDVFGISFPDFPGAVAAGGTVEEAIERGRAVLAFHIEGMVEDGAAIPTPRTFFDLTKDPAVTLDINSALMPVQVPFDTEAKQVRVNISIDENLLRNIDQVAERNGFSRSSFIAEASKEKLRGAA